MSEIAGFMAAHILACILIIGYIGFGVFTVVVCYAVVKYEMPDSRIDNKVTTALVLIIMWPILWLLLLIITAVAYIKTKKEL